MLLRETMWEIFLSTGNIDAYLAYRACLDCQDNQTTETTDEAIDPLAVQGCFANQLLREVRWH